LSYIAQRKKRKVDTSKKKLIIGMIEISFWVWRWDKWYSLERIYLRGKWASFLNHVVVVVT
jgi:hypothetical protein